MASVSIGGSEDSDVALLDHARPLAFGSAGCAPRLLLAGVGYHALGDQSAGPVLVERLRRLPWPEGVIVEDLSYSPLDVLFRLQETPSLQHAIFVAAVARGPQSRSPRLLDQFELSRGVDVIQAAVAESLSGVISLGNLLLVLNHFEALPPRWHVIEIEPERHERAGLDLSASCERALADCIPLLNLLIAREPSGARRS